MKSKPDTTVLGTTDLADQPKGKYVFLVEGLLGPRQAFYVDRVRLEGDTVIAEIYTGEEKIDEIAFSTYKKIIQIPVHSIWGLISAEYAYTRTYREALEDRKASSAVEAKMVEEIFGKDNGPQSESGGSALPGTPVLGQYL